MRRGHSLTLLSLLSLGIAGCLFETDTRVAGGAEDFPNSLEPLGYALSSNFSEHAEWDQFSDIPALSLAEADSLAAAPPAITAVTGLAKALATTTAQAAETAKAAEDSLAFDLSDTAALGVARMFTYRDFALKYRADTTVFRWDDQARDGIPGNELLLLSRGVETYKLGLRARAYRYENLDSTGGYDRADFHERILKASGISTHRWVTTLPGADGDFATLSDNRLVAYRAARISGGDTLDDFEVSDADGDGMLWGDNDSGLVDIRDKRTDPLPRPWLTSLTQRLRAVFFKEEGRAYPVTFTQTRLYKDGKKVVYSVKGIRPDSAFGPGDTVTATVRINPAAGGPGKAREKTSRFKVRLSEIPGGFAGNLLLRFTMETLWRDGAWPKQDVAVKFSKLTFIPAQPMPSGDSTLAGEFDMEAEFADGSTGKAIGTFKDKRIEAELVETKAAAKRRFKVQWDALGKILLKQKL